MMIKEKNMIRNHNKFIRAAAGCFIIGLALILASCGSLENPNLPEGSSPALKGTTPTAMTPTVPIPVDASLQGLIEKASTDLARRLTVPEDQIVLLEASAVVWSDSSLGCPEEGMMYAQVLTPGYLIRLGVGDLVYEYHASKSATILYCENPLLPLSEPPPDI